jgi:hypothetical protein
MVVLVEGTLTLLSFLRRPVRQERPDGVAICDSSSRWLSQVGRPLLAFSESSRQEIATQGVRVAVTQPDHVAVNEILIRPTDQTQ